MGEDYLSIKMKDDEAADIASRLYQVRLISISKLALIREAIF